ncbi:MAG: LLM class flavin-dependent oxidoreductase [Tepidiformaceae bacterium]
MKHQFPQLSVAFQTDKALGEYAELGLLAETYGFDTVSVYGDLMFQPPLAALLTIANATRRIRLGPACLNPFTIHPVEIAGQVATLDAASRGRTYLGLSRGAWLDSIGIRPPRPLTAMREAVALIRHLLRGDESALAGTFYTLSEHHRLHFPVGRRDVPILIGTWGAKLASLAGELASEVKVGGSANPALVPLMLERIAAGARRAGREPAEVGLVFGAVTVVDEDGKSARERARAEVARYLPIVGPLDPTAKLEPDLLARIENAVNGGDLGAAGSLIPDSVLDRFAFAGTPRQLARQAQALLAAGATRIEFGTPHGLTAREGLRLLGEQVLPRLR